MKLLLLINSIIYLKVCVFTSMLIQLRYILLNPIAAACLLFSSHSSNVHPSLGNLPLM